MSNFKMTLDEEKRRERFKNQFHTVPVVMLDGTILFVSKAGNRVGLYGADENSLPTKLICDGDMGDVKPENQKEIKIDD